MSHRATSWALEAACPSPSAKLVLLVLADAHNGHTGDCFPTIQRLVSATGLSESGVKTAIRALEADHLIAREIEKEQSGRTRGVRYHLNIEGRGHQETPRGQTVPPGEGAHSDPTRGHQETPRGGNGCPLYIEPEKEPGKGTGNTVPGKPGRVPVSRKPDYPPEFTLLWAEFPKHPNASKADALKFWLRLDDDDRENCLQGAMRYAVFLASERRRRADYPACHLATFINGRRWEAQLEAAE